MSTAPAAENVTIKRNVTVLRNNTPLGTVERIFTGSNPWTFTDANGYGTEDTFPTVRAAVAALLRRADRANTQQTTTDTEQQPAGQNREERRALMQDLYGYEGTVTASLMEITDRITDLSLAAAAGMPDSWDTTAGAVSLLTRTNTLTDLLDRTVGDYPATIPGELRAPIYQLGDRIRNAAGTISRTPTTDPVIEAAHATTSRLLRAWADTVQRITL